MRRPLMMRLRERATISTSGSSGIRFSRDQFAFAQESFHFLFRRCFGIDAQRRLGSRLSNEQPRPVFKKQLRPVKSLHAIDGEASDRTGRRGRPTRNQIFPARDLAMNIAAVEIEFAELSMHLFD